MAPALQLVVNLTLVVLALIYNTFTMTSSILGFFKVMGRRSCWLNLIWYWSKWPAFAYLVVLLPGLVVLDELKWWSGIYWFIASTVWYGFRNIGDDDDHKKLKKSIKEKVAAVSGKLVVQPA